MTISVAIASAMSDWAAEFAEWTARRGTRVAIDPPALLDRGEPHPRSTSGKISANGSCELIATRDGWIAVNLARATDRSALDAWVGQHDTANPWPAVRAAAAHRSSQELVDLARLLGMPVAIVGEVRSQRQALQSIVCGVRKLERATFDVLDLTSMWAGPLCGELLTRAGASVTKVESRARPDGIRLGSPALYKRLNTRKLQVVIDFESAVALNWLRARMVTADVVLTSARPRAFTQLGIDTETIFDGNPGLVWVAVSGYGWTGDAPDRVAFGDDAAAAGGLVDWVDGEPHFHGDAVADPLTGIAAAVGALRALDQGGGVLVDAPLAVIAADVARRSVQTPQ